MVAAPELILAAVQSLAISQLQADLYLTFAMFLVPEIVPFEFLVAADEAVPPQWDHSATTRLVERWDEVAGEDKPELLNAVDGLDELVGFAGGGNTGSGGGDGCVPVAAIDAFVCVGDSISQHPVPGLPLDEAVVAVRPLVRGAVEDAWPKFERLFGVEPDLVKVFLSNLTATGGYTFGTDLTASADAASGICHVYVDVLSPDETDETVVYLDDPTIPDGVPRRVRLRATVAHQLFHCFQHAALLGFDPTLWEGAATWAEHHVDPELNTENQWMATWVSDPDVAFASRLFDASFAFVYADLMAGGSSAVIDVLRTNSIASLDSDFERLWHDISVAAWNQDPVEMLVNDGGTPIPAAIGDLAAIGISSETAGTMDFVLPLYSRDIQSFEVSGGTSALDLTGFARLWLDLSQVPSDVRISALVETASGWLEPMLLSGSEFRFCRMTVGACNDTDPAAINPITRIVLIVTNVDNGIETFSVPWNTYNPHLHGDWVRTEGPISTVDTSPYWIVGTELGFDESALLMTEDTGDFSLANADPGWECLFEGAYSITADPDYNAPGPGNVSGTITVTGPADGEAFVNDCVFEEGPTARGVHFPIADGSDGTFGFEIRDYDTLWIYAFERIYVYERVPPE